MVHKGLGHPVEEPVPRKINLDRPSATLVSDALLRALLLPLLVVVIDLPLPSDTEVAITFPLVQRYWFDKEGTYSFWFVAEVCL